MAREILLSKKTEQGLRLDPRTKLLLIFIISIFVMGGTGGEAMGLIRLVLCTVPAILLLTSKQCAKAVGYIAVFSAFYAVQIYVLPHLTGILNFLDVKDGEIEREYTPAEFDSLSDGIRKEMGLRPFSLSKLKPANQYQAHTAKQMEFQNFCFAYKKREPESLHIPSAELPVGETIAIIGLNGAGKSTLARCICGLEKKCGLLQVDGKTLDWKARLKHCYMVMQDTSHQLFTESVTDEVLLSMDNKDETVVDKILKQFDLLEYKDRHPLSLSGGQKQRVAIASAIVSNREIIVFDEPTSGLDLKHMREVARSLKSLADQGKTLLVITHDPELVMAGCSYVVHMEKGQVKESYPLDESGSKKVLDFFRIRQ